MLKPGERSHLLELLRPPAGCRLDLAVGTTFSLDLMSALMLPLSFAFFDWEQADGQPVADPLALMEALRRYGDRFTIFCQSGQIHLHVSAGQGGLVGQHTNHLNLMGDGWIDPVANFDHRCGHLSVGQREAVQTQRGQRLPA